MRNLKKLLAVIVAICVLATMTVPAFAESDKTAAEIAETLGILIGDGEGVTDAYLAKGTTRMQAAIIYLRLLGLEEEAYAETSEETFADADEVVWAGGKAVLAYLKNRPELGWIGDGTNFNPNGEATAQMIYKVILTALGYVEGEDFEYADTIEFAGEVGLDAIADVDDLTNEDLAEALVEALSVKIKDGSKTLLEKLIEDEVITEADAEEAGLVSAAVALDVSSAVAINSKVVEVTLGTAAAQKDLTGVTVADSTGKDVAVSKIEFAPWATDGKTVLVTLAEDTAAGSYYTLTAGTKSVNFGGRGVDSTKPKVTKVESTEYNEIKVTFSEPILLGGTVSAALKYTPKTALETSDIAYASSTSITVATADQAASLYGVTINGFVDLAGNTMDEDTGKTFIGTVKSTTKPAVSDVQPIDSTSAKVIFNVKMDDATSIDIANYSVALKYTPKTAIEVTSAVKDEDDATGKTVIVTFATDTVASLYELTVKAGVVSKYGVASTADSSDTFIGIAKDEKALGVPQVTPVSNTKIKLDFGHPVADKVDPNTTQDMFSIKMKYTPYTELAITDISIEDQTVTINTASQSTSLYEIVIKAGIKDAKGNATTADLKTTFIGKAVAAKISAISGIVNGDNGTTLTLTFNQNVGEGAFDVANYFIDGGIGYPSKAEAVANQPDQVKLTIPATTLGTKYTITVKNVKNADGVAMDAAGVTKTFIGAGSAAAQAQMIAVQTIDEQTLKVYFDRDVTDAKIKGVIWDSTNKCIKNNTLAINVKAATDFALTTLNTYAYQDLEDATALIIRIYSAGIFNGTNIDETVGAFELKALTAANLDPDYDKLVVMSSETDMPGIGIASVSAVDKYTLRIDFDQPTYFEAGGENFATVESKVAATGSAATALNITQAVAVSGTNNMQYLLKLNGDMVSTNTDYKLKVNDTAANLLAKINDTSTSLNFVTLADEDGTTGNPIVVERLFVPSFDEAADITDISIHMTDEKTIVVYYGQAMDISTTGAGGGNSASVLDFDNYLIKDGSGNLVKMDDGTATGADFSVSNIGNITWTASDNSVKIVLNKTIKTAAGGAFLYFDKTMANVTGTANVEDDGAQIIRQFAISDEAAAEVGISSATVSGTTVTINLDQPSNINITDVAQFLANFRITKTVGGTDTVLEASDISGVTVVDSDTITVTLVTAIPANSGVTIEGILTNTSYIKGLYNEEGLDDTAEIVVAAE